MASSTTHRNACLKGSGRLRYRQFSDNEGEAEDSVGVHKRPKAPVRGISRFGLKWASALLLASVCLFYCEFHTIEEFLEIPPGARLDKFFPWWLLPEKELTAPEWAALLQFQMNPVKPPAPPSCNKNATIAVCMLGTRWEHREAFNLGPHYQKHVLAHLGGVDNVDMFFNYGPGDPDNENDLGELWPYADRTVLNVSIIKYNRFRCPRNKRPFHEAGFGLAVRLESCLRRVQIHEKRCGKRYQWIMRDRPDVYHDRPVFQGKSFQELDSTKIYTPCLWKQWGVCDLFAMVPRQHAQTYYNFSATMPTLCIPNSLTTDYTCKPDRWPWEGPMPECMLAMQLQKAGIILNDTIRIAGERYQYNLVRNCSCENGVAVMPPRYFGPKAGYCGQDVPGAPVNCSPR